MSRHFAIVGHSTMAAPSRPAAPVAERPPGEYKNLLGLLFQKPTAVAILASGSGLAASGVSKEIAAEVSGSGKRVVLVRVSDVLRMNPVPVPDIASLPPAGTPNIWVWSGPERRPIEFFKSRDWSVAVKWLDVLRRNFDAVLLDCPALDHTPGVAGLAALADATVLVVECGQTAQQVKAGQTLLQSTGATVAGCVLVRKG